MEQSDTPDFTPEGWTNTGLRQRILGSVFLGRIEGSRRLDLARIDNQELLELPHTLFTIGI